MKDKKKIIIPVVVAVIVIIAVVIIGITTLKKKAETTKIDIDTKSYVADLSKYIEKIDDTKDVEETKESISSEIVTLQKKYPNSESVSISSVELLNTLSSSKAQSTKGLKDTLQGALAKVGQTVDKLIYKSKVEYAEFASKFIYDITCRAYIIRDNTDKDFFNSLYDELNAKDIIRESWENYGRFEIEARYSKSEFSYGQKSDEVSTGLTRSKTTSGTETENGNIIILGKLNEKTLSVSKRDKKVFLDEEELPDFTFEIKEETKENGMQTVVVTLTRKSNNEKLIKKRKKNDIKTMEK